MKMDNERIVSSPICRLCLCKCENHRNMLVETEFASKVMQVFPKVQITAENCLSNFVCDYCYDFVSKIYDYFETVNANQDELLKLMIVVVPKEEIFAEPIDCGEVKPQLDDIEMKDADDTNDEGGWFDNYETPEKSEVYESSEIHENPIVKRSKQKKVVKSKLSKKQLSKLSYFELINLPPGFTSSFSCPICPKNSKSTKFKTRSDLVAHISKSHYNELEYDERVLKAQSTTKYLDPQCDLCHKVIKVHQDHKFIHYDIKPFKCDICNFTSFTKQTLACHIIKHKELVGHKNCFYCPLELPSTFLRNAHIREKHSDRVITCDLCGIQLLGKNLIKDHLREHKINSMQFECERCIGGVRFPNERVLALHKEHHVKMDKAKKRANTRQCQLCERQFKSDETLETHMKFHTDGRIIPCEICGRSVVANMRGRVSAVHMKTHETKQKTWKCKLCDTEVLTRQHLFHHHRKMHDPKEQSCYKCGKLFPEHFMKLHLFYCKGSGGFHCNHCPMVFARDSERHKHTQQFHLGFNCRRCNKSFENKSEYKRHQKRDPEHLRTMKKRPVTSKKPSEQLQTNDWF